MKTSVGSMIDLSPSVCTSPAAEDTDAAVIAQSVAHPGRFAVVFDRHHISVHRYLARRVGTNLADDLLSETFLIAFRQRAVFRPLYDDARPWLLGIANSLAARHTRTETRRYAALSRLAGDTGIDDRGDEASERLDAQALRGELSAALARVAPADRDTLLLYAWAQLSYREIATALDIPVGTVRSRLNRARRQLQTLLADIDPNTEETS